MSCKTKPDTWDDIPNGEVLARSVDAYMSTWFPRLFGYHFLKLGPLAAQMDSMKCSISHHFSMVDSPSATLCGDYTHLPLQNASIDAIAMQLLLEFEDDPYRILRETDRVLISGGYLFIVGINPLSTAFIGKLLPRYQNSLPWNGRFFTPSRVRDWLGLLGYQIVCDERSVYHSMIGTMAQQSIWQESLAAWLPSAGSLYIIGARKLESPLTPIQAKRKVRQPQWSAAPTAGRSSCPNSPPIKSNYRCE